LCSLVAELWTFVFVWAKAKLEKDYVTLCVGTGAAHAETNVRHHPSCFAYHTNKRRRRFFASPPVGMCNGCWLPHGLSTSHHSCFPLWHKNMQFCWTAKQCKLIKQKRTVRDSDDDSNGYYSQCRTTLHTLKMTNTIKKIRSRLFKRRRNKTSRPLTL
jgi:hypothetical protein